MPRHSRTYTVEESFPEPGQARFASIDEANAAAARFVRILLWPELAPKRPVYDDPEPRRLRRTPAA